MLEFQYDGAIKSITATTNCIVDFAIVGAGGGGGGYDAQYNGSYGLDGSTVTGRIVLSAGETIYCLVGSTGQGGASNARGTGGGLGGYSLDGFSGGTGGNAGPSGASGSGGGGGGATIVWKLVNGVKQYLAIAAGGGGGGGAGRSPGYIISYSPFALAPQTTNVGRGGLGQHHQGDGGGPGGGGGGNRGGAGGTQPAGDSGAMSGSNGYSTIVAALAYTWSPATTSFTLSGKGGPAVSAGTNGYAGFNSTQTDITVRTLGSWASVNNVYVRQSNAWVPATDVYTRKDNVWVRVYGDNTPNYVSTAAGAALNNTTGDMVPYPPPPVVYYTSNSSRTYQGGDTSWSAPERTSTTYGGSTGEGGYSFGGGSGSSTPE